MRAIKLNYDVVLTIFAEPSLWRAKIFEKNQDDPKNKNHKSTCTALKPISVIRKKEYLLLLIFFFWIQYLLLFFFLLKSISCSPDPTSNSKTIYPNFHELFWPTRTSFSSLVCLSSFFRQKQSIWLVIKLAKIQDSHDSEFVVGSGEQNTI